jgi:hypothetical protein
VHASADSPPLVRLGTGRVTIKRDSFVSGAGAPGRGETRTCAAAKPRISACGALPAVLSSGVRSRCELAQLVLDQAFQMLADNVRDLRIDEALFVPPGGYRSTLGTLKHIAGWS